MLSHGNLAANARAIIRYLGITAADRGLCVLPFHFSYGNSVLHSHLLAGATLVARGQPRVSAADACSACRTTRITGFAGVPSTFALLLGRCAARATSISRLALRHAGRRRDAAAAHRAPAAHELPHVRLFIMYGQTEATARLTYLPPDEARRRSSARWASRCPGVEIEVATRTAGPCPPARSARSARAARTSCMGYWNDAGDDRAGAARRLAAHRRSRPHAMRTASCTSTAAAVDMIKVGAFRVSPQEIEEVHRRAPRRRGSRASPAMPDEMLGQAVKAVIVPRAGATLDDARREGALPRSTSRPTRFRRSVEFVARHAAHVLRQDPTLQTGLTSKKSRTAWLTQRHSTRTSSKWTTTRSSSRSARVCARFSPRTSAAAASSSPCRAASTAR